LKPGNFLAHRVKSFEKNGGKEEGRRKKEEKGKRRGKGRKRIPNSLTKVT
jgi:hypothetical protein